MGAYGTGSSAPNFGNVPNAWAPLHTAYRAAIARASTGAQAVEYICNTGGGYIPHDQYLAILAQINDAQNRVFAVQTQAKAMK
jgi:hypothetical protein